MADLANTKPTVIKAQVAIKGIKKQHLVEVCSIANPPEAIKLAMESVCTTLGYHIKNWKSVQTILHKDDFIQSIVNFNTVCQMTKGLWELMKKEYLSCPVFNFEIVNQVS